MCASERRRTAERIQVLNQNLGERRPGQDGFHGYDGVITEDLLEARGQGGELPVSRLVDCQCTPVGFLLDDSRLLDSVFGDVRSWWGWRL